MALCKHFRRLAIIMIGVMFSVLLFVFSLLLYVFSQFDGTGIAEGRGGGITCGLVFGAAVHRHSLPGPGIERRVATAARLYREGLLQHIILSGGKGSAMLESEAKVMHDVAVEDGIKEWDVTLEDRSRSTWENLRNSRPLTGSCTTVVGISDRYHLARITFLAHMQGWDDLQTLPADLEPPWPFELQSISREVLALLYYLPTSFSSTYTRVITQ